MSIQCQKCFYVMEQAEVMGYMSVEAIKFFKQVIIPVLLTKYATRDLKQTAYDLIEKFLLVFLNTSEIQCHVCHAYVGWSCNIDVIIQKNSTQELDV